MLVTFALLPAVFIIWKHLSTVRILFLIVGCYDVAFFFPLVKIFFPWRKRMKLLRPQGTVSLKHP